MTSSQNPQKPDGFMDDLYKEVKSFVQQRRKENNTQSNSKPNSQANKKPLKTHKVQNTEKQKNYAQVADKKGKQQKRGQNQGRRKGLHHNSRPKAPVSLEPRDAQHFLMKPRNTSPKSFPYLTPKQAFEKHAPRPKEMHKKRTEKDTLRIIPFGGMEQVGINCIGFEYNNEVVIVDMGIQFPDEHMHGVQGRIPDISYLKGKKVVAVLITHGHIDHIGGVPYLMRILGTHVPVYAARMATELINKKQEDFKMPLQMKEFHRNNLYSLGEYFHAEPFTVDHSIPDSLGIRIHTPVGKFIHTGDWKFDSDPRANIPSVDHQQLIQFGEEGVRALLSDSTNAHLQGSSMSEKIVIQPIEDIFTKAKGRIFTGTFSSIIERLQIIIETAEKFNRKVVLLGRGMNTYFEIAKKLGYVKHHADTIISMAEADKLPDNQVCICCTGAQGERYAALMRIATGESQDTEFRDGDSVILSSSVIPGNERKVQELMDILYEQNVHVHHYRQTQVHSGGHAREEDVKIMIRETKPEYFVPIYGSRFMTQANADIARGMGYSDDKIFNAFNGQIMEFTKTSAKLTQIYAPHKMVTVDGYAIGFSKEKEFAERHQMGKEGVLIVNISMQGNKPKVHLINHGFLDLSLVPDIRAELIDAIIDLYKDAHGKKKQRDESNKAIRRKVQSLIWMKLGKEPVVIVAS